MGCEGGARESNVDRATASKLDELLRRIVITRRRALALNARQMAVEQATRYRARAVATVPPRGRRVSVRHRVVEPRHRAHEILERQPAGLWVAVLPGGSAGE